LSLFLQTNKHVAMRQWQRGSWRPEIFSYNIKNTMATTDGLGQALTYVAGS